MMQPLLIEAFDDDPVWLHAWLYSWDTLLHEEDFYWDSSFIINFSSTEISKMYVIKIEDLPPYKNRDTGPNL